MSTQGTRQGYWGRTPTRPYGSYSGVTRTTMTEAQAREILRVLAEAGRRGIDRN